MTPPRGIRNHNPGNLRYTGTRWRGLDTPAHDNAGFCRFTAAVYGIRALALNLLNYAWDHNIDTIEGITHRWAPRSDGNDPDEYARAIGKLADLPIDTRLDWVDGPDGRATLERIARAICQHENGEDPYTVQTWAAGISTAHY
ncbi:MAG: structural protein [bacterium]|nr:structural protein [bacterium]